MTKISTLVEGRDAVGEGDLLGLVGGVDVEAVVEDADAVVGVAGGDGDLELGGEEVGGIGEVELEDGGVLEVELGLCGTEDEVDDEDDEEDDDDEEDQATAARADALVALVVAAVFRHRCRRCHQQQLDNYSGGGGGGW